MAEYLPSVSSPFYNLSDIMILVLPQKLTTSLCSHYENVYSNISKISPFSDKNSDIFHISAQNIDCGYSLEPPRRSGSKEYLRSMFLTRNMKNNVYPCKPLSYYIKVGFKGVKII